MIEIMTHIHDQDQILSLKSSGCHRLTVTTPFLSSGIEHTFDLDNISMLFDIAENIDLKLGIMINRLIKETEWTTLLDQLHVIGIMRPSFYIVSDVGVLFYLKQQTDIPVYFHSDTTIANQYDASLMLEHGADIVMPARELTLEKKLQIIKSLQANIMIPVFGYQVMSRSYRPLLSNYFSQIEKNIPSKHNLFYFKEDQRDNIYLGYEDDHGFSMFTDEVMSLLEEKQQLEDAGLTLGWIDSNFLKEEDIQTVIEYFHDRITLEQTISRLTNSNIKLGKGLNYQDTATIKEEVK